MSSVHRYKLAQRSIDSAAFRGRQLMILMTTMALFLLCWAVGLLLSYCVLSVGLVSAENEATAVSVWTIENATNGLVFVGLLGLVYSFFIDGTVIIILINPGIIFSMNFQGLGPVFILIGLARIVEAIQSCISSFACTATNDPEPVGFDVRALDIL